MTYDYAILGAGISGMTTATILAKHGFSTVLIEKAQRTAPVVRGFRRGKFLFDTGFHYTGGLGRGEVLDVLFRYIGFEGRIQKRKYDEEGFDIYQSLKPRINWPFPYGYERILESLAGFFPDERGAIDAYLKAVRNVCESLPYVNLESELPAVPDIGGGSGSSLKEVLDGLTGNEELKNILSMHCLLHGSHPWEVPFALHASVVGLYYKSVHGVDGGGLSIADAFDERLKELGVEVMTGQGAARLDVSPAGVLEGVVLENGEAIHCKRCVSTIHPKVLLPMVPETAFRPIYRKRLAALEESASAHILYLSYDGPTPFLEGRNLFLFSTSSFPRFDAPLEERPIYITALSRIEGSEEKGCVVICPAENSETEPWASWTDRPREYVSCKREIGERLLGRINHFLPGFSSHANLVEHATPITMHEFANSPAGALYGVKHKVGQFNPVPQTRLRQLFLAGQSTAAPGLLGAMISAFLVCGYILGHDRLREELRQCR